MAWCEWEGDTFWTNKSLIGCAAFLRGIFWKLSCVKRFLLKFFFSIKRKSHDAVAGSSGNIVDRNMCFPDSHKQRAEVDGVSLPLRSLYGKLGLKNTGNVFKEEQFVTRDFYCASWWGELDMPLFSMDFCLSCAQVKCVCMQNSFAVCCFLISWDVGIQMQGILRTSGL